MMFIREENDIKCWNDSTDETLLETLKYLFLEIAIITVISNRFSLFHHQSKRNMMRGASLS